MLTDERHVVLLFPVSSDAEWKSFDAASVIRELAPKLPKDTIIFDAGGRQDARWITIKRVVPEHVVLANEEAIYSAAKDFRRVATGLIRQLARHLSISEQEFKHPLMRMNLGKRSRGTLGPEWEYFFHGYQCRFTHRTSGQAVDVELGFDGEFGVLDPWFFCQFVRTTPEHSAVAALFRHAFHDPKQAITILERRGRFRRFTRGTDVRPAAVD